MENPWFRHRRDDEGSGYGVRSWQGIAAGTAVVAFVTVSILVPIFLGARAWTVYWIAVFVALVSIFSLLRVAKARSD